MIYLVKEWDPEDEGYEAEQTFVDFGIHPYRTVLALLESQRNGTVEHLARAAMESVEWIDGSCCGTEAWTDYIDPILFFDNPHPHFTVRCDKPLVARFKAVGPHILRELLDARPKLNPVVAKAFAAEIEKL